ncbi:NAD(P)-binding protein [Polychaeton citri CBS 116435]|uniref:NAD(P)-binding protein n=1 Tax=Polychaeton citri CBS 116435 TaxID=1314669 RepID=A0A9P4UIM5_9PEZI|nr:NAD(P)-binding protein [Polychaeton citri CBS 116435]
MRVFITGATGYIGGQILHTLTLQHPSAAVYALVRDATKGEFLKKKYAQVTLVIGDLDASDLIKDEASRADVVINAANNKHIASVESVAAGFQASSRNKPGYLLQISGASVLSAKDITDKTFGEPSKKQYNDLEGSKEVLDLIANTSSRALDRAVLELNRKHSGKVNTALIFAPLIYGQGQGAGHTESVQLPSLCKFAIEKKRSYYVGKGEATWGNVHIADVGNLFASLADAAVNGKDTNKLWNDDGLYFTQTDELSWKSIAEKLADASQQKGVAAPTASLSTSEIEDIFPAGSILLGTNARGRSDRGAELLGFKATQHSLADEIPLTFLRILNANQTSKI